MSVTTQVLIGGIDVSALQEEPSLKIGSTFGGALENHSTASLEFHETGNFYLTPISDTVHRPDNASTIGSTERPVIPYTKQGTTTTWAVVNNQIVVTAHDGAAVFGELITAQTALAGYVLPSNTGISTQFSISCTVNLKVGDASAAGIAFRVTGANNYLYCTIDNSNTIILGKRVLGVNTTLATTTNAAYVSGGTLRVDVAALSDLIQVYYIAPGSTAALGAGGVSESFNNNATKHGYWISTSASTTSGHSFNNLLITPLSGDIYTPMTPMEYKEIIIKDTSVPENIFAGIIDYTKPHLNAGGIDFNRTVTAKDYSFLLDITTVYKQYTNYSDSAIVLDIMSSYFAGYFNTSNVHTTLTLPSFQVNYTSALEAMRQLCAITGCQFYIDYNKNVYYGFNLSYAAPCSFSEIGSFSNVAGARAFKILDYERNMRALASRVTVIGGVDSVTNYTDTISTGGSAYLTSYQLAYKNITNITNFNWQGVSNQLLWTFKDQTNPNLTPVCQVVIDGSLVKNYYGTHTLLASSGLGPLSILPGQKLVIWENSSGSGANAFTAQSYYFESGKAYTITYSSTTAVIEYTGAGIAPYARITINTSAEPSFFGASGRSIWIGPGWPIVVDGVTGLVQYINDNQNYWQVNNTQSHYITYSGSRQYVVTATRADTRNTYGSLIGGGDPGGGLRYYDVVVQASKLTDTASILALARSTLLTKGSGITALKFQTFYGQGLRVGQTVNISSPSWQVFGTFIIRKIDITFPVGAGQASYEIEAGDYNPDNDDLVANLLRQQVTYNLTPNDTVTVITSVAYTNMTIHYYDDGTLYGQTNAFWG